MKGYEVEVCFGAEGCPNRAISEDIPSDVLQKILEEKDLLSFLKTVVKGPIRGHHKFRISLSGCPNACSRPQIADLGLIGASRPQINKEKCNRCGVCLRICEESAITAREGRIVIDLEKCLFCGSCIRNCPIGAIYSTKSGYRILVGGKLGRHPRLAQDLGKIFPVSDIPAIVSAIVDYYKKNSTSGERLGTILEKKGLHELLFHIKTW